jgi:competence protein ComEA
VEIIQEEQRGEIYFLKPGTSAGEFFQIAGLGKLNTQDFVLSEGMSIIVDKNDSGTNVVVSEMNAAQRLALGMPLDINEASRDDLILVEGIGEATAGKIIELREKLGRFKNIEQLKLIKGIKEKRLSGLRKYLYVRRS